jgi:hypothetical protein
MVMDIDISRMSKLELLETDDLQQSDCKTINYIDLCSGIGGFRVALENFQKKSHLLAKS